MRSLRTRYGLRDLLWVRRHSCRLQGLLFVSWIVTCRDTEMRVLIYTAGSAGDTHPFLGIGRTLADRGHQVILFANEVFEDAVRMAGLEFVETGDAVFYERAINNPDLWDSKKGFEAAVRPFVGQTKKWVRLIESRLDDDTVLVGSTLGFPARIIRELHDVPLVLAHTAPVSFRSVHRVPKTQIMWVGDDSPRWLKRAWLRLVDLIADRAVGPEFNATRREFGLEPINRIFNEWLVYSPDVTIGMFPEWFAPRQPDWPDSLHLTGFPLYDESDHQSLEPGLEEWLNEGDPPILFAPGSANVQAAQFLATAVDLSSKLDLRALLIAPNPGDVPRNLPDGIRHESYVPFSHLLPGCRGIVSHGGIGTCGQALAAGIPHLVTHLNFDQRDNGSRLEDLNAGRSIPMSNFTGPNAPTILQETLDTETASQARDLAARIDPAAGRNTAADLIEEATQTTA